MKHLGRNRWQVDFFAETKQQRAKPAQLALVLLLPLTVVAAAHAFVQHSVQQNQALLAELQTTKDAERALAQQAQQALLPTRFSNRAALGQAQRVSAAIALPWEPALRAIEKHGASMNDVSLQELRLENERQVIVLLAVAKNLGTANQFVRTLSQDAAIRSAAIRRAAAERSGRGVEVEIHLQWTASQ